MHSTQAKLVDMVCLDLLEEMSFADGKAYNENLMPICRGDVLPDRK